MVLKSSVKKGLSRLLKRYQVYNHPCQIESCTKTGSLTLINPVKTGIKEEVNKEDVYTKEAFFLCSYHSKMYRRYKHMK